MSSWGRMVHKLRPARKPSHASEFERCDFSLLYADDNLRITSLGDTSARNVMLCFTGIKQAMRGVGAEEFIGSSAIPDFSAIFVSDLNRSWFNAVEPEVLLEAIAPHIAGKQVFTLGNSMGGFGAIWITTHLPVSGAIAFAAQYSVKPDIVPEEHRWQDYRAAISEWRVPSLANCFVPDVDYFTINGDADLNHFSRFPSGQRINHLVIADCNHNPANKLKEAGVLGQVIAACTRGENPVDLIAEAGLTVAELGQGS